MIAVRTSSLVGSAFDGNAAIKRPSRLISSLWKFHCGTAASPIFTLVTKSLSLPSAYVVLKVQRPVVYLTSVEKSFGMDKPNFQITGRLKNLLVNNGFEFTENKVNADLWFDVKSDAEKGSITGSIYVTYLTSSIKVITVKEGKEIYATTLDRVKGYGLDYDKSSIDAYNKTIEELETERIDEIIEECRKKEISLN